MKRNHIAEIARQGVWANLTGGWYYEPASSLLCNTTHFYLWFTLLVLPLLLGVIVSSSSTNSLPLAIAYVSFTLLLFLFLKAMVAYLHHLFDSTEPIMTYKEARKSTTSVEPFGRGGHLMELVDLGTMIDSGGSLRSDSNVASAAAAVGTAPVVEQQEGGGAADRRSASSSTDRLKHVRIGETERDRDQHFLYQRIHFPSSTIASDRAEDGSVSSNESSRKNSANELLSMSERGSRNFVSMGRGEPMGVILPADSLELLPISSNRWEWVELNGHIQFHSDAPTLRWWQLMAGGASPKGSTPSPMWTPSL